MASGFQHSVVLHTQSAPRNVEYHHKCMYIDLASSVDIQYVHVRIYRDMSQMLVRTDAGTKIEI